MPNWAATRIVLRGENASDFNFRFCAAFRLGLVGGEGASLMSGDYATAPDGAAGSPRACWDLNKVSETELIYRSKWRNCFTETEFKKMSVAHPDVEISVLTVEQGMGFSSHHLYMTGTCGTTTVTEASAEELVAMRRKNQTLWKMSG